MPQECVSESVFLTAPGSRIFSMVVGQIPPFANVAAITAAESHVTSTEHIYSAANHRINVTTVHATSININVALPKFTAHG